MSQFTDEKLRFRELSASSDTATKWQSQDLNTGLSDSKTDALSSIQDQCEEEYNCGGEGRKMTTKAKLCSYNVRKTTFLFYLSFWMSVPLYIPLHACQFCLSLSALWIYLFYLSLCMSLSFSASPGVSVSYLSLGLCLSCFSLSFTGTQSLAQSRFNGYWLGSPRPFPQPCQSRTFFSPLGWEMPGPELLPGHQRRCRTACRVWRQNPGTMRNYLL